MTDSIQTAVSKSDVYVVPAAARPRVSTVLTDEDRKIGKTLYELQQKCRPIFVDDADGNPVDYVLHDFADGRRPVPLYRPKVHLIKVDGVPHYAYPSVVEGDKDIVIDAHTYVEYESGSKVSHHMPLVSRSQLDRVIGLLGKYSFFQGKCAYQNCPENLNGSFNPGLRKKAELILRRQYLPPAADVAEEGKDLPISMELKQMCYRHWLLGLMRDELLPMWMQITVDTQSLPVNERFMARIQGLKEVIREINRLAVDKAKASGDREPSIEDTIAMVLAFATEMTGGN